MRGKRVILDTNLWISFLISNNLEFLDKLIDRKKIRLIFSTELIEEFLAVAVRPKFKKYFSERDIQYLLELFDLYGEVVNVKSDMKLCRDEKDNFLLNLAVDSEADYLVTGDADLLEIKEIEKTKIITITVLKERLK